MIKMKCLVIIPARYASTRFPAKPLAKLGGQLIVERVYRQVEKAVSDVVIATDDSRIASAVEAFGGRVVMTSTEHRSGTDRCYEALQKVGGNYDIVINVQGDEPFIDPEQIKSLIACFDNPDTEIATLVKPFSAEDGIDALQNPNSPKVVVSKDMRALYFSRAVIPYLRGIEPEEWLQHHTFYKHIGIYAFRSKTLGEVTALPQSSLEVGEKLEQLRWLENGYRIGVGITTIETIGIDTPEDLARAEAYLASHQQ